VTKFIRIPNSEGFVHISWTGLVVLGPGCSLNCSSLFVDFWFECWTGIEYLLLEVHTGICLNRDFLAGT